LTLNLEGHGREGRAGVERLDLAAHRQGDQMVAFVGHQSTQTRPFGYDPVSGKPVVMVARPLLEADGQFIGATALVRPVEVMLEDLKLSENWFSGTREMLVATGPEEGTKESGLRILAVRETGDADSLWQNLHSQSWLQPDKPEDKKLLLQQIATGRGGSLKMGFQGVETHWIFSGATNSEPFVLILVPHSQVIAQAVAARNHVVEKILKGLGISGGLLIGAIAAVFFTAFLASQKVTRPLRTLVMAAENLAGGDYRSRVELETNDEVAELGQVFNQLGPALEERERMASSLALAGDIQRQLLPQTQPQINGFEIFGGSEPCDETGGDYYDFIPRGDGCLALAVGDVSGHGIGAALLMAGARGVLRSHATRCDLNLPTLFATLNEHLCQDIADEQFMTLFYGVLTAKTKLMHWCSAGHGPLFFYRCREKTIAELGSTGLPLGIIAETIWEEGVPFVFEAGDILLVGTDGIWEARNPQGKALGTERLKALIRSRAGEPAAQIHTSILELVSRFRMDSHQEDDITLTVIKAV
jgi:sigma-B regulation protein RsbU (phosphoserine phosphatase)